MNNFDFYKVVEITFVMNNPAFNIMAHAIDSTSCHILKSLVFKKYSNKQSTTQYAIVNKTFESKYEARQ